MSQMEAWEMIQYSFPILEREWELQIPILQNKIRVSSNIVLRDTLESC